ncbi:MAG: 50S ribosomal protein L6 [Chthoniobacterales bacterium]|jgi:large subunit ribosomal protein L6|nr:50S ribosomal protein L6 [Chthoniobacterales bacterium]
MSRIGNKPVPLPPKVKVNLSPDRSVQVEGPKGKLSWQLPEGIEGKVDGETFKLERKSETRQLRALHGLARALVNNMVTGVSAGFTRQLEIQGVGFKAAVQGQKLNLSLGFSHAVVFDIPQEIKITVTDNTKLLVEGIDRQLVGQVAANIRAYYPPEPYKGKGVRYSDEKVRRKEGKTVQ